MGAALGEAGGLMIAAVACGTLMVLAEVGMTTSADEDAG
jgi:hypothetical protein